MGFSFTERPNPDGAWVSARDLAGAKTVFVVTDGFLVDDPNHVYEGEPAPRFIVQAVAEGESIKFGLRKGYGRDEKLLELDEYLSSNPGEEVSLKFEKQGAYLDPVVA